MNQLRHDFILAVLLVTSVSLASCTGTSATRPPELTTTVPPSVPSTTLAVIADVAGAGGVATRGSTDSKVRDVLGIPAIALLTPASGGGSRPELAWESVDQAFFYNVVLLDPTGRGYWGWEGTNTSVHVGGEPVIKEGLSGPSVIDGMSWQVAAYDTDLNLIALSPEQPIAP